MRRDDPGPYSLEALAALPPPQIFTTDPATWKPRLVAWFEQASGRTLYPMQVEMLLIEALAYAMSVLGTEAQLTCEQHLVAFATGEGLDRLGANRSTQRLPAAKARCTVRFSLTIASNANVLIPAGTQVKAPNGPPFATLAPLVIRAGLLTADVAAEAVSSGAAGNGYLPGQINTLTQPVGALTVSNLTPSEGGADPESEEAYRLRVANAFDRVSSGGGYGWYRETAMGVSSAIVDCGVTRPQPCHVNLYPLLATGAAGADVRAAVLAAFETERALENRFGDLVAVLPPTAVNRSPVLTVRARAGAASLATDARAAAEALLAAWSQRLAALVAPHDLEAVVRRLPGVVDVACEGLPFQQLGESEFLAVTSLTITMVWLP